MATSIFLAKLIGPILGVIGLALLLDGRGFRRLAGEFLDQPALIYLSGVLTLAAGLAIVLTHNVWTADWRVLITVLGWLSLLAGALRILIPRQVVGAGRSMVGHPHFWSIAGGGYLVVGALLSFFGYRT